MSDDPSPGELLGAFLADDDQGAVLASALVLIQTIPEAAFQEAVQRIRREQSVGPLLRPGNWTPGDSFRKARAWEALFAALVKVRGAIDGANA